MAAAQRQQCSEPAAKGPAETKARDHGGREQLKSSRDSQTIKVGDRKVRRLPGGSGKELDPLWLSDKARGAGQLALGKAGGRTQDSGHKKQRREERPPGLGSSRHHTLPGRASLRQCHRCPHTPGQELHQAHTLGSLSGQLPALSWPLPACLQTGGGSAWLMMSLGRRMESKY